VSAAEIVPNVEFSLADTEKDSRPRDGMRD